VASFRQTLLLSVSLCLLAGCRGKSPPPPLVVGHVASQIGPQKEASERASRGIRLAVKEINKDASETLGRSFEVRHTDTRGKLDAFEAEAVRLVSVNKAVALLGGTSAEEVELLDKAHVPLLTPSGFRTRAVSDLVFFTGLSPADQGQALAQLAAQEWPEGPDLVILADEQHEEALLLADAFAREFPSAVNKKDAKLKPARVIRWSYGKDVKLSELLQRVKKEQPKAHLLLAGEVGALKELRKELPETAKVILFGGPEGSLRALQEQPPSKMKVFLPTAFVPEVDTPRGKEFVQKYKAEFSEEPDVHAALAYDNLRMLFEALRRCESTFTPPRIRDELAGLKDFAGLTGPLTFRKEHTIRRPAFIVRLEEGQVKTVKRVEPRE
jgi:branched-chain amino acid transport system substrate-binding protein